MSTALCTGCKRARADDNTPASETPDPSLVMVLDDEEATRDLSPELVRFCKTGDVLLVCEGNKAVQCHTLILSAASDVLRDMFSSLNHSAGAAGMARIPMPADSAQGWLNVLSIIYPVDQKQTLPDMRHARETAAIMHKYNMPRLAGVWRDFVNKVKVPKHIATGVGSHWLAPYAMLREAAWESSSYVNMNGCSWETTLHYGVMPDQNDGASGASREAGGKVVWMTVKKRENVSEPRSWYIHGVPLVWVITLGVRDIDDGRFNVVWRSTEADATGEFVTGPLIDTPRLEDMWERIVFEFHGHTEVIVHLAAEMYPYPPDHSYYCENEEPCDIGYVLNLAGLEGGDPLGWMDFATRVMDDGEMQEKCIECIKRHGNRIRFDKPFLNGVLDIAKQLGLSRAKLFLAHFKDHLPAL